MTGVPPNSRPDSSKFTGTGETTATPTDSPNSANDISPPPGLTDEQLAAGSRGSRYRVIEPGAEVEPASVGAVPVDVIPEMEIPLVSAAHSVSIDDALSASSQIAAHHAAGEEVDLSDEWEAMVQEVAEPAPVATIAEMPPVAVQAEPVSAAPEAVELIDFAEAAEPCCGNRSGRTCRL